MPAHKNNRSLRSWEKSKYLTLEVAMFRVDVVVFLNMNETKVKKVLHRITKEKYKKDIDEEIGDWDKDCDAYTDGRMCEIGGGFIVLLNSKPTLAETISVIVHEMTHVSQYLLRERRVPIEESTEEVQAYLIEHLVCRTLQNL